ncbi:hypothetical protein E4U36_008294, partial [Claviceps purpurea]
ETLKATLRRATFKVDGETVALTISNFGETGSTTPTVWVFPYHSDDDLERISTTVWNFVTGSGQHCPPFEIGRVVQSRVSLAIWVIKFSVAVKWPPSWSLGPDGRI